MNYIIIARGDRCLESSNQQELGKCFFRNSQSVRTQSKKNIQGEKFNHQLPSPSAFIELCNALFNLVIPVFWISLAALRFFHIRRSLGSHYPDLIVNSCHFCIIFILIFPLFSPFLLFKYHISTNHGRRPLGY